MVRYHITRAGNIFVSLLPHDTEYLKSCAIDYGTPGKYVATLFNNLKDEPILKLSEIMQRRYDANIKPPHGRSKHLGIYLGVDTLESFNNLTSRLNISPSWLVKLLIDDDRLKRGEIISEESNEKAEETMEETVETISSLRERIREEMQATG
jgi:hypothetical protein